MSGHCERCGAEMSDHRLTAGAVDAARQFLDAAIDWPDGFMGRTTTVSVADLCAVRSVLSALATQLAGLAPQEEAR